MNHVASRHENADRLVREDLAAAYRLVALLGMDDGIYTHISARTSDTHDQFYINPFGWLFREITASSLVKIDLEGNIVEPSEFEINPAGFTIHSAIHSARPDANCVLHTHTVAGVAVSSLTDGLQPSNQWAFQFYDRVAYHDYEGLSLDLAERERLVASLDSNKRCLILRNHGLLTIGRTVAEAFILMYNLERACRVQIAIQSTGQPIRRVDPEICRHAAQQYEAGGANEGQPDPLAREWNSYRRLLEASVGDAYRK